MDRLSPDSMVATASTLGTMSVCLPSLRHRPVNFPPPHRKVFTERCFQIRKPSCIPLSQVHRRNLLSSFLTATIIRQLGFNGVSMAETIKEFKEYIDIFDGYSLLYPRNWIQVRGAGADIFFRDPFVLDENLSIELSSPSSSRYKSVEDLGPPDIAAGKVLKQYLMEFMSTRLGVRRESSILSWSSRVADDGKLYYQVEVNIKSYANNNELAVMPQDREVRLEWDRRYLSVLGVGNNRLYELRLQAPESVFVDEENDLREVLDSFRVISLVD
ncbi:hypothetical protein KSP39_PZI004153 [Platanthera zijinensis]|uniref:PsbP C-terminal domain-containing protein n=1 Tax=Platanthera zijinensis TaxID=2320716 RepID=A0AAP0GCR8_9ASPA